MPAGPVNPEGLSGILNVAKPVGMTSHDVVAFVRRQTGQRRVGHAGTLDPAAAGVLLVCLGDATRLSEFLLESNKQYRATIRLGAVSTTDDAEGIITPSASSVDHLALPTITAVLRRFQGEIEQVPPAFSAIKVGGQALYRSARAGQVVQAPSRRVRIDRIEILTWIPPDLTIDVTCSKGTYIRALARDIGRVLGVGGYLRSLLRTASGSFRLDDSLSLEEIARAAALGYLDRLLYPPDVAVSNWPALFLPAELVRALSRGLPVPGPPAHDGQPARAYSEDGYMVGLVRYRHADGRWHPDKVFAEANRESS
ncbi:MAG: tRNA pseudouridine(55) synthase TruB [Chloroflexi bacterium]|nr:tRNA pseudouridine(55) synthase TruB [Chloroflexota bacterium]